MKKTLSTVVLISVLAGCASPASLNMPTPLAQAPVAAAAPQAQIPVVATGALVAGQPKADKALATTPAKVTPALPGKALITTPAVKAPEVKAALTKPASAFDAFDPMKALSTLPTSDPTAPDLADDDSDTDDTSSFTTQGWLWGWGGVKGRDRGLRKFADEEARLVEWLQYPSGWTAMRAVLSDAEIPGAVALATGASYNRTPTSYKFLPKVLQKNTTRHLKFFRKQDIVKLKSKHLAYYQVQKIGSAAISGYIARAEAGSDRYIAYYDGAGHFLWAFGTNYPMYGYSAVPTSPLILAVSNQASSSDAEATP